jgi:hypothetical protein
MAVRFFSFQKLRERFSGYMPRNTVLIFYLKFWLVCDLSETFVIGVQ